MVKSGGLGVVVVHEQTLLRRALRVSLHQLFPDAVITELSEPVAAMLSSHPSVVVMGIYFDSSPRTGVDSIREFTAQSINILVLLAAPDARTVVELITGGALGVISTDAPMTELKRAVESVAVGELYLSSTLALTLLSSSSEAPTRRAPAANITEREKEVLTNVARGLTDRQIGEEMYISLKTVHSHLERIREKVGLRRRSELATYAVETGLTTRPIDAGVGGR